MLNSSVDTYYLKDRFSISTSEYGSSISSDAISYINVDSYGVNIYLNASELSGYSYQFYVTYNDPSGDDFSGVLQGDDGSDVSSFSSSFYYDGSSVSDGSAVLVEKAAVRPPLILISLTMTPIMVIFDSYLMATLKSVYKRLLLYSGSFSDFRSVWL